MRWRGESYQVIGKVTQTTSEETTQKTSTRPTPVVDKDETSETSQPRTTRPKEV